ncbi:hypothetical protein ACTXT7_017331 [Hymenolepis weldensis]
MATGLSDRFCSSDPFQPEVLIRKAKLMIDEKNDGVNGSDQFAFCNFKVIQPNYTNKQSDTSTDESGTIAQF